jgi:hypothetical protein
MPRPHSGSRELRLALAPTTVGRLIQWQGSAVSHGFPKPTYSELLDVLVDKASEDGLDPVGLLAAGSARRDAS